MTDQQLTDELAVQVLGWRLAPNRYIRGGRNWIPRWRFRPLTDLASAFELLDHASGRYTITCERGRFKVEVHVGTRWERVSGDNLARTISSAVSGAVGVDGPSEKGGECK